MSQDQTERMSTAPINVIIGGAGLGLLLAAAGVAYVRSQKQTRGPVSEAIQAAKAKGPIPVNLKGKWALNTAIKLIEHDTSRKVLLSVLKAMAKRAR
jgi:hypothetical protein